MLQTRPFAPVPASWHHLRWRPSGMGAGFLGAGREFGTPRLFMPSWTHLRSCQDSVAHQQVFCLRDTSFNLLILTWLNLASLILGRKVRRWTCGFRMIGLGVSPSFHEFETLVQLQRPHLWTGYNRHRLSQQNKAYSTQLGSWRRVRSSSRWVAMSTKKKRLQSSQRCLFGVLGIVIQEAHSWPKLKVCSELQAEHASTGKTHKAT